jgi:predicted acetyltransferase
MGTPEVRAVGDDEIEAFLAVDQVAFGGGPMDAERVADYRTTVELDRTRAVFDGGRMVAASATLSLELTLPGATILPVAGVTLVGVLPTARRRGHLRRMMTSLLDDAVTRHEPLAALLSSESLLYGRFGYGLASTHASVEIESRHAALLPSAPDGGGRIELCEAEHAAKVLPGILDAARRLQPGDIGRPAGWWDALFRDPEKRREGAGAQFYAVHESPSGEADGYAVYRIRSDWQHGLHNGKVAAGEIVGVTPAAEADLWRFLFSLDLTEVVEAGVRPVDDPLRWMLVDPRRLRTTMVGDFLWVRLLDVAAALSARRYGVEGTLVLDVADDARPGTPGRYRLDGGPDGAACGRTTDEVDLALGVEELGAVYLGGVAASTLAAAGRVTELRPGALRRADAMLASSPRPFTRTAF